MSNGTTSDSTSLLSRNVKIQGDLRGHENVKVEGYIKGTISLDGNLFVGGNGVVEADVQANNVVIEGRITGNVSARNKLEIHPSGKLIGDFEARSIDIKEGAIFEGRSRMISSANTAATLTPPPATSPPAEPKKK